MKIEDLQERQSWTLEQKVSHTIEVLSVFLYHAKEAGRTPYISFSGGKDSTVLLHIARRFVDKNIKAVFCNTGNEWPEIVYFTRYTDNVQVIRPELRLPQIIEKYGFPLLSKEQAQGIRQAKTTKSEKLRNIRLYGTDPAKGLTSGKISDCWQFLINEPFMVSEKCCDCLKKRPFAKYAKQTGALPIIGTMAAESKLRQQQYIRRGGCNSFDGNNMASYPLSVWTDADIWAYLRRFNVPYCELYNVPGIDRTGCVTCGFGAHLEKHSRFERLYERHPKLYLQSMNYTNNGVTYREALRKVRVPLPDECRQMKLGL